MALLPDEATAADIPVVIPDAGPWITLAHSDAIKLLAISRRVNHSVADVLMQMIDLTDKRQH